MTCDCLLSSKFALWETRANNCYGHASDMNARI